MVPSFYGIPIKIFIAYEVHSNKQILTRSCLSQELTELCPGEPDLIKNFNLYSTITFEINAYLFQLVTAYKGPFQRICQRN